MPLAGGGCCPRYPDCTAQFHDLHYCQNWPPEVQGKLDVCTTTRQLAEAWNALAEAGDVDLIGGSEWHHAVAHLRYWLTSIRREG